MPVTLNVAWSKFMRQMHAGMSNEMAAYMHARHCGALPDVAGAGAGATRGAGGLSVIAGDGGLATGGGSSTGRSAGDGGLAMDGGLGDC